MDGQSFLLRKLRAAASIPGILPAAQAGAASISRAAGEADAANSLAPGQTGEALEPSLLHPDESSPEENSDRRKSTRHPVEEACVMVLLRQGGTTPCQVLNLSLDGCLIRTRDRFHAGIHARVELSFKVSGNAFRFTGVTRWTDGRNLAGIGFVDVIPRRREALAEMLGELEAAQQGKSVPVPAEGARAAQAQQAREAAERQAREQAEQQAAAARALEQAKRESQQRAAAEREARAQQEREATERRRREQSEKPVSAAAAAQGTASAAAAPARPGQERRAQRRHAVDDSAIIYIVRAGSQLRGRIQDISAGGCSIRAVEPFPVGIYTRVETEFRVEGLPFRLGGVVQSIHDKGRFLVGIRFLDMSERKREQLAMLIEEIDELAAQRAQGKAAEGGAV